MRPSSPVPNDKSGNHCLQNNALRTSPEPCSRQRHTRPSQGARRDGGCYLTLSVAPPVLRLEDGLGFPRLEVAHGGAQHVQPWGLPYMLRLTGRRRGLLQRRPGVGVIFFVVFISRIGKTWVQKAPKILNNPPWERGWRYPLLFIYMVLGKLFSVDCFRGTEFHFLEHATPPSSLCQRVHFPQLQLCTCYRICFPFFTSIWFHICHIFLSQ